MCTVGEDTVKAHKKESDSRRDDSYRNAVEIETLHSSVLQNPRTTKGNEGEEERRKAEG